MTKKECLKIENFACRANTIIHDCEKLQEDLENFPNESLGLKKYIPIFLGMYAECAFISNELWRIAKSYYEQTDEVKNG